jgi:hypothetical protein
VSRCFTRSICVDLVVATRGRLAERGLEELAALDATGSPMPVRASRCAASRCGRT